MLANSHEDSNTMEQLHRSVSPCQSASPNRLHPAVHPAGMQEMVGGSPRTGGECFAWDKTDEAVMKAKKHAWMEVEIGKLNKDKQLLSDQLVAKTAEGESLTKQLVHEHQHTMQLNKSLEDQKAQFEQHNIQSSTLLQNQKTRELAGMSQKVNEAQGQLQSELAVREQLERRVQELEKTVTAEHGARVAVEAELEQLHHSMENFAVKAMDNLEAAKVARQETLDCEAKLKAAQKELEHTRSENAALVHKSNLLESAVMAQQESAQKTLQAHAMLQSPDKSSDNFSNLPAGNLTSWISQNCADARAQLAQQHTDHARGPSLDGHSLRQRVAERIKFQPNRVEEPADSPMDNRLQQELVRRLGREAYRRLDEKKQEEVVIQRLGEELYMQSQNQQHNSFFDQMDANRDDSGVIDRTEFGSGMVGRSQERAQYPTRSQSACRTRSGSTRQQMESRLASTKFSNHLDAIAQTVLSTQNQ